MPAITIRQATQLDAKQICNIGRNVSEFSVNDATVNFWPEEVIKDVIESDQAILLVAEASSGLIGFIIGNCNRAFGKIIIENIYVLPHFRTSGIGEALLSSLLNIAKESDYQYVSTLVPESASNALKLYTNSGFSKGEIFRWLDKPLSTEFTS